MNKSKKHNLVRAIKYGSLSILLTIVWSVVIAYIVIPKQPLDIYLFIDKVATVIPTSAILIIMCNQLIFRYVENLHWALLNEKNNEHIRNKALEKLARIEDPIDCIFLLRYHWNMNIETTNYLLKKISRRMSNKDEKRMCEKIKEAVSSYFNAQNEYTKSDAKNTIKETVSMLYKIYYD